MTLLNEILKEITSVITQIKEDNLTKILNKIPKNNRIFVDGEGRSGFQAKSFAMRLMHIGYQIYVMGETITPAIRQGDIYIAISGSGKTKNTVNNTLVAKKLGATIIAVTSKQDSDLAKIADETILVPGKVKNDKTTTSIQLLSSLFDQSVHIVLDCLCLMLSKRDNISEEIANKNHINIE